MITQRRIEFETEQRAAARYRELVSKNRRQLVELANYYRRVNSIDKTTSKDDLVFMILAIEFPSSILQRFEKPQTINDTACQAAELFVDLDFRKTGLQVRGEYFDNFTFIGYVTGNHRKAVLQSNEGARGVMELSRNSFEIKPGA